MKTYDKLYSQVCSLGNLIIAWRKAREGKTLRADVMKFEENLELNLLILHNELKNKTYNPKPLITFILRDPKTRVISKSDFRDRIVHHAIINIIQPIFEKQFIYDSCANQLKKGNLFALNRFDKYLRKVSHPIHKNGFCLKADIKQYFQSIDHKILLKIIQKRIIDKELLWLIQKVLSNNLLSGGGGERLVGMPLGNLTSQFFANVYLNELDYFVKNALKIKYYIRYVDDFVILHKSYKQLKEWKDKIDLFLRTTLNIELHIHKSRIIPIKRGIDFVGFRNFYHHRLLRRRNIRTMQRKIKLYKEGSFNFGETYESYKGWNAYAMWANTFKIRNKLKMDIVDILYEKI